VIRTRAAALAVLVGLLWATNGVASAGGGRMAPVRERYEPGQRATLVGYTGDPVITTVPVEPFYAYLRAADEPYSASVLASDVYVGDLVVQETQHRGYLRFRVSVTFPVPANLPPGDYLVRYCDDPCTGALIGDLLDSPLSIGVDPARRVVREWPLDEPEIANLAPESLVVGPNFQATAAQLRTGRGLAPLAQPGPPAATAAPVPTTVPAPRPTPAAAPVTAAADVEDMDWRVPTALVLGAAAGTALFLGLRQRAAARASGRRPPGGRTPGAVPAGPG
jgi:hypothetical protein